MYRRKFHGFPATSNRFPWVSMRLEWEDGQNMGKYEEYVDEIERLFEENRAKDAEKFMLNAVREAQSYGDKSFELQMLNELIGYYRQTSEKEQLVKVIERSITIADEMGLKEHAKIPYATTLLNAANGYRSIGNLDKAKQYYEIVSTIYQESLQSDSMLYAGLYNNMSLLYQETGEYQLAGECLLKALSIVTHNQAPFEIAVTYANLANVTVQLKEYEKAKEYALEAIHRFEERNTFDPHYCAGISALGMCYFYEGDYQKAYDLFQKGMDIVEKSVGQNTQYVRLKENRDACKKYLSKEEKKDENKTITGLELSRRYFEEFGRPMLEKQFPEYISQMAVGLVGEGSDCFGFDDEISSDHDFGPDFCIWIPDELYETIGTELKKAYEELPDEFMGYKRSKTFRGKERRGVMGISAFYQRILGVKSFEEIDFSRVPDYALATATNGEVFVDGPGRFSEIRDKIKKGYSESILFLKLAEDAAKISQTGQYNFSRMLARGDRMTADMMLMDCIRQILILSHHMENAYPPHDKWLHKSCRKFEHFKELDSLLKKLHASFGMEDEKAGRYVEEIMEQMGEFLARELYKRDYISDISTYLDGHTDELFRKSQYSRLGNEELADRIAKLEFEAFEQAKNEGRRVYCPDDRLTFLIMRKSQYLTWNRTMLLQYLYDFTREYELGHNLISEKYGRMMESTAPEEYEKIADNFEPLSEQKKTVIEQIVAFRIGMHEAFLKEYPRLAGNTGCFHACEDSFFKASYETCLRGEISTYSDKMLQLYGAYIVDVLQSGGNIARMTIENTAKLYGYDDLETFEKSIE